jgi:Lipocalin-like domain
VKALRLSIVLILGLGFPHPPLLSQAVRGTCPAGTGSVIGGWHLLAAEDMDSLGRVTHPYGDHPFGLLIYTSTGEMSIQMTKTPLLPNFPAALEDSSWSVISPKDMIATLDGYYAYFGTYTVDTVRRIVTHHVTADIAREFSGTDQDRPYRVHGDTLVLGDDVTWRRIFLRACVVH